MNVQYLENLLSSLTGKRDEIMKIASSCSNQPESAGLIAFIIITEFLKAKVENKKTYLYLIHQIILLEHQIKRKSIDFIKAFGVKLREIFQDFTKVNDITDMDNAYLIIKRWEKQGIYHPEFLIKLRMILQPKYDQLAKEKAAFLKQQARTDSTVYHNNKKSNPMSSQIQQHFFSRTNLEKQIQHFSENQLNTKKMKDLNTLIEEGEHCRQTLIDSICKLQNIYIHLSLQGEQILNDLSQPTNVKYYETIRKKWSRC